MTAETALLVGCGSIGSRHAQNLSKTGVDVTAFDIDPEQRHALAVDINCNTVDSLEAGLDANPDIVFVCTPSNHHIDPARQAAEAGIDLFVEKPLSNTVDGVSALVNATERRNLVTMAGCNKRFHPAIRTVKQLLDDGAIGDVVSARIESGSYLPDWHPWEDYREMYSAKAGVGGALLDFIHGINYGRWFFGDANDVSGMLSAESSLEIETEDTASLIARHEGDVQCEYHFDYVQRVPSLSGIIVGESGTIRWETEQTYADWETNDMYVDMLDHFLACVDSRKPTTSPLREGMKDLEMALAAKQSNQEGSHVEL